MERFWAAVGIGILILAVVPVAVLAFIGMFHFPAWPYGV